MLLFVLSSENDSDVSKSVAISRFVVKYDTRPLVNWTGSAPETKPGAQPSFSQPGVQERQPYAGESSFMATSRFPIEKLAVPRPAPEQDVLKQEPPLPLTPQVRDVDDMDWSPSYQQPELRPTVSVHRKSGLKEPLPFYGSLPPAPKPPAWAFLNRPVEKPIQQVIERNPFHHNLAKPPTSWQGRREHRNEAVFAPPRFFPASDYTASTGLEAMFDRAFTIKSLEDERGDNERHAARPYSYRPDDLWKDLLLPLLRLGLLLASIFASVLSQKNMIAVQVNYIEIFSLGSAGLIAGFGLLESLKRPQAEWNGVEILIYLAELGAAIYLGSELPGMHLDGVYFDKYGMLLLAFMAIQEIMGLRDYISTPSRSTSVARSKRHRAHPSLASDSSHVPKRPVIQSSGVGVRPSVPSFSSTASHFSSQSPNLRNRFGGGFSMQDANPGRSLALNGLDIEDDTDVSDAFDRDSDTETTATTATNNTSRYGQNVDDARDNLLLFSPRRSELGPGISGLSLDDQPYQRVTRSQTKRQQGGPDLSRRYQWRGIN